jgi:uncharacterized protein (TIGR02466 family)
MATVETLFPTLVCRGSLSGASVLNRALLRDVAELRTQDKVGRAWSRENYRGGYTSYASLCDLHYRTPAFATFAERMQREVDRFARALRWDLRGRRLVMTDCWMNVMPANTYHTLHLHPHSVLSGTYYLQTPPGSVALKLEDPRMPMYMNAPVRVGTGRHALYYSVQPKAGQFVLFESWLRHEVPPNGSRRPRVSIAFNYSIEEAEES